MKTKKEFIVGDYDLEGLSYIGLFSGKSIFAEAVEEILRSISEKCEPLNSYTFQVKIIIEDDEENSN